LEANPGASVKKLLYLVIGIAAILVVAAVSFYVLFDPNDFRDRISAEVQSATGREFVIEGDLELSLFPWLAIELGKTRLGNAPGFGDEPFARFDSARLSVRLLPLLLRREVAVGVAELDGMNLNLAVDRNGRGNWEDLLEGSAAAPEDEQPADAAGGDFEISGVGISNATLVYADAQVGETYSLTDLNLTLGSIGKGGPIAAAGGFDFELQPAELRGRVDMSTDILLDPAASTIGFADVEISAAGVDIGAQVEPFDYAGEFMPVIAFETEAFSLKSLMRALGIEPPETADPDALGKLMLGGTARMTPSAIGIDDLALAVDDSSFTGKVSVARDAAGTISVNLAGDSIDLTRYMAPATDAAAAEADVEAVPVEIPADLVRAFNLRGELTLEEATLSGLVFTGVELGVNARDGDLRMHPISAELFGGTYAGDVRIDATGDTPVLSVNEQVRGVNLGSLAAAMFEQENISGAINGTFTLTGRGTDLADVQQSLRGEMAFELVDGAWEGTDVWYELRKARALLKKEPAPEAPSPPRTRFSTVKLAGPVRDGVFTSEELFAELPFMQLTGGGSVDLPAAAVDFRLSARVLQKPEFASEMSAEELEDFTEAVIPLRVDGPLAAPSIKPDIEAMLKKEVEKKVRDKLEDKLKDLLKR
jgi:AsmA protein